MRPARSVFAPNFPAYAIEPDLPAFVSWVVELHREHGTASWADGSSHELHACFVWSMAALFYVAGDAGTDDVFPSSLAPSAARNHMVDTQKMRGKSPTAVLAFVAVARQDVAAAEMHFLPGEAIKCKQANHTRHLDLEVDGFDPIVFGLFDFGTQFAYVAPGIEGVVGELALLHSDDFGQFAAKESERPPHVHDMDGHVEPVENQHAARESAAGGERRGGVFDNSAPASRVMHPGTMRRIGCMKALHLPPPELCQRLIVADFFAAHQRERQEIRSQIRWPMWPIFPHSDGFLPRLPKGETTRGRYPSRGEKPIVRGKIRQGRLVSDPAPALG